MNESGNPRSPICLFIALNGQSRCPLPCVKTHSVRQSTSADELSRILDLKHSCCLYLAVVVWCLQFYELWRIILTRKNELAYRLVQQCSIAATHWLCDTSMALCRRPHHMFAQACMLYHIEPSATSSQHSHSNISQVSAKSQLSTSALSCDVQVQLSAYFHVALACRTTRMYIIK